MKEFESLEEFKNYLNKNHVSDIAVQSINLNNVKEIILKTTFSKCIFLGCEMDKTIWTHLHADNYIFQHLDVPFNIYPNKLYNKETLYNGYNYRNPETYDKTFDKIVYDHYIENGKEAQIIKETLARRLHDHSITDALYEFIEDNFDENKVVAIMGGHSISRNDVNYRQVSEISRKLTEHGYLLVSGGGPGAMEATHVGAWFAGQNDNALADAINILSQAPTYHHPDWLGKAFEVLEKYPDSKYKSLGVPTWLYGHEPPTPFATHIAKYFANSVREEGLLAIAKGGVVFSPGSAGTLQEIFQGISQKHYKSYGDSSPLLFLNKTYWNFNRPVYPVIELMALRGDLQNLDIGIYDSVDGIVNHIISYRKLS